MFKRSADVFEFSEFFEAMARSFAAQTRLLYPAKRNRCAGDFYAVKRNHTVFKRV